MNMSALLTEAESLPCMQRFRVLFPPGWIGANPAYEEIGQLLICSSNLGLESQQCLGDLTY